MPKNKFNSKYAGFDDIYSDADVEGLYGGGEGGFNIFENPEAQELAKSIESETHEESNKAIQKQVSQEYERDAFSPIETLALQTPNRRSELSTEVLRPDEEGNLVKTWVPENVTVSPSKWLKHVKERIGEKRRARIEDPVRAEARQQKTNHFQQNRQNRELVKAVYALIPESLRQSEAYQCRGCNGQGCLKCNGLGYNTDAARSLTDIKASAAAENHSISFHNKFCSGEACHPQCRLQPWVDQFIRIPHRETSNVPLRSADVKAKPNGTEFKDEKLRYVAVDDQFEPIAPALTLMGTKKLDEPLKVGTVCHFLNWDLENPDSNIGKRLNPEDYNDNEHVYNAGGGGRDKQMFAVVTNVQDNGKYDIVYSYRPIGKMRTFRRDLLKGRKGKREVKYNNPIEAMNVSREMDSRFSGARKHVANLFHNLTPFFGERSTLQGQRAYDSLESVDGNFLAPVTDPTAELICHSGTQAQTMLRNEVANADKLYTKPKPSKKNPLGGWAPGSKTTVNKKTKVGTGFGLNELREALPTINSDKTAAVFRRLINESRRTLGIDRNNFDSDEAFDSFAKKYDIGYGWEDRPGYAIEPRSNYTGPNWSAFSGQLSTEQPRPMESPNKAFNSSGTPAAVEVTPARKRRSIQVPLDPPTVDDVISTPEGRKGFIDVVKSTAGQDAIKTPQDERKVIEGIKQDGGLRGAFEALGFSHEEEEE